jgi:cytochrome c556
MREQAAWAAVGLAVVTAGVLGHSGSVLGQSGSVLGHGGSVLGQSGSGNSPAEVVKVRQQAFKRLGAALKVIHNELHGSSPDTGKIGAAATEVKSAASHLGEWFPAGSGPQAGVKTHAKADIWADERGFAAARAAFVRQAEKSARQLTDPGERGAWKDAAAALGQTCRDCHDSYRAKAEAD